MSVDKGSVRRNRTTGTESRLRRPSRGLRVWLVMALAAAGVTVVGATVPSSAKAVAGAASTCVDDGSAGCKVTLPCPTGQTVCPTIDVTPSSNVSDGQYVYVSARNVDPTGSIRVAFCSANGSTTDPQCLTGVWQTQSLNPISVPNSSDASVDYLTTVSYPVYLDPPEEGNVKIPSHDLTNATGKGPGFFCDNGANRCQVVVTIEDGQGPGVGNGPLITADNSAVVPITFATQAAGCPTSAPQLQVSSTFTLEHFMPAAIQATCDGKNGVVALNTANDASSVVTDFVNGSSAVSFIDNVGDPNQLAGLIGQGYAFVPVALTGTAESVLAGAANGALNYPINSFKMTPTMVAGLLTSAYQSPRGNVTVPPKPRFVLNDNLSAAMASGSPAITCAQLSGCPASKTKVKQMQYMLKYNAFDVLNRFPNGTVGPQAFGSFNANVPSGSSFEATSWFCEAPNAPFQVTVDTNPTTPGGSPEQTTTTITDTNLASQTLVTEPLGSTIWPPYPGATWVYPDCHGYSNLPALSGSVVNFSSNQSPALQAKSMRGWCYAGGVLPQPPGSQPCASFGLMDSSEAQFFGLSSASLENASGNFVAPTVTSLQAAANDLQPCPNFDLSCPVGTYKIDYGNTDPAAYALPDITYAIVPNGTLPYEKATAIKNLLNNLVDYSHSGNLPAGYAPLPDAIYTAAKAGITAAIHSEPAPPATTTTTTTTTTAPATSSSSGDTSSTSYDSGSSSTPYTSDTSALPLTGEVSPSTANDSPGTSKGAVAAPPVAVPTGFLLVGLAASTRYLLPAIVLLTLGALIGGGLLLFGPNAANRRREGGSS